MDTSIPEFPSFAYFINILSFPNSNSLFRQLTVLFTRNLFSPAFLFQRKRNGKFRFLPLIGGRSDLTDYAYTLDIYSGKIHIDAETGDGIDSNGTLTISGRTVEVFSTSAGDNSPLDSDGALTVTGGTVLAVGNSGTAQTPESGLQNYIVFGAAQGFGMQQSGGAPKNAEDAGKAFGNATPPDGTGNGQNPPAPPSGGMPGAGMSGDSEIGCDKFSMKDGKLISNNGGIFYTTNTESEFYIENTEITAAEDAEFFLRVTGNQNKRGWGTVGANGADCLFTAADQEMNGDIVWDKISTLKLHIANGSTLTGAVLCDAAYDGNGSAALYIDESSSRVVTGNSTLTALYCAGSLLDKNGKTVSVVSPDGSVLKEGDSEYTVTAKEYADTADMSKMGTYTEWSEYETEKPSFFEASSGSGSSGSSSAGSSSGSSSSGSSSAGTAEKPTADDKKNEDFFDDVSRDDWFYDAVKFAWENGFMKGTSERTFSPEAPLSRAMLITVLYRPEGQPSVKALDPTPFTDIDTNDYCFDAVAWAKGNAILYGVTDTTFAPNQNVTREQLAAVLYRYAKYKGAADSDANSNSETDAGSERQSFSDADEISDYAAEAIGYCRRAGLLKGKDNNLFAPNEYTVRAQIAAVLQRIAK